MKTRQRTSSSPSPQKSTPEGQIAMNAGLPYCALHDTFLAHPYARRGPYPLVLIRAFSAKIRRRGSRSG